MLLPLRCRLVLAPGLLLAWCLLCANGDGSAHAKAVANAETFIRHPFISDSGPVTVAESKSHSSQRPFQCAGLLVGASTLIGEAFAWNFLHRLHPSIVYERARDIGFWDQRHGKFRGCMLGDYMTLLDSPRQSWPPLQPPNNYGLCATSGSAPTSFKNGLPRSPQCLEVQQQLLQAPTHSSDKRPPAASPASSSLQALAGFASTTVTSKTNPSSETPQSKARPSADTAQPPRPWWWLGYWPSGKPTSARTFGRQVKTLQPSNNTVQLEDASKGPMYLADISSTYLFTAVAPHRLHMQLPEARILVILSEPITHVITQFNKLWLQQHIASAGNKLQLGTSALLLDQQQRQDWVQTLMTNITHQMKQINACQSRKKRSNATVTPRFCNKTLAGSGRWKHSQDLPLMAQAVYADSLAVWLELFPADQILIWSSEGLAADPTGHIQQLASWLGLESISIDTDVFTQRQVQLQAELDSMFGLVAQPPQQLLDSMQEFYRVQNERLFSLLQDKGFAEAAAGMRRLWVPRQQWHTISNYTVGPITDHAVAQAKAPSSSAASSEQESIFSGSTKYLAPEPSFMAVTDIDPGQVLLQIPQSFMGISHEWPFGETINSIPGYKDTLKLLSSYGTGRFIIRVGGGSTDKQDTVPAAAVFDALRQTHEETGVQYILGLNFQKGDVELARAQWEAAKQQLPAEAILTFEIGNEPNFYEGMEGNKTALQYVRCCLVNRWRNFAKALSCPCGTEECCSSKQFAGPVWGHINVFPSTLQWFQEASHPYTQMTTIHWYKATKEAHNTPVSLLDDAPMQKEIANLQKLVKVSSRFGKPLRVAEMNTISNSGRNGISNVFAAALWTLDGAFEVAAAGAVGINLHQGAGQNHYAALIRRYEQDGQTLAPVSLRPPFYAIVMFQQAVRNGSYILRQHPVSPDSRHTVSSSLKLWPLLDVVSKQLRFVIINKHASRAGTQRICVSTAWGSQYPDKVKVTRMLAEGPDPLSAKGGISLGGVVYGAGGQPKGKQRVEWVVREKGQDKTCWDVYIPPGSAALVESQQAAFV